MESLLFAAGMTTFASGAAMSLFAWNVIRQNRRREDARVTLLSGRAFPVEVRPDAVTDAGLDDGRWLFPVDEFRSEPPLATGTLFTEPEKSGAASRRTVALAGVCLVLAIVFGTYRWLTHDNDGSGTAVSEPVASATMVSMTPPVKAPADPRVELLSLSHRATTSAFLVTGRIRNQAGGAPLQDVVAVVHLIDPAGRVFMTVRAPIKGAALNAGEGSDFSATAARTTNVARYRVEFQTKARDVIPHFDLRQQASN